MNPAPGPAPAVAAPSTPARHAFIALGANLPGPAGSPADALRAAIVRIGELPATRVLACSRVYRSDPVDAGGPRYLNQVVQVDTGLAADRLLGELHRIEAALGRQRRADDGHNPPRPIDLDLLLVLAVDQVESPAAGLPSSTDGSTGPAPAATPELPHPRMHQRLFVLQPLAELAPGLTLAGHGTLPDLIAALQARGDQSCEPVGP